MQDSGSNATKPAKKTTFDFESYQTGNEKSAAGKNNETNDKLSKVKDLLQNRRGNK